VKRFEVGIMLMFQLREIMHDNVNMFVGLVLEGTTPTSAWKYCSKGSLQVNLNLLLKCFTGYAKYVICSKNRTF